MGPILDAAYRRARRPTWRALVVGVLALLALTLGARSAAAAPTDPTQPAAPVVVSLTFDDGTASEYWARAQLSSRSMHGTFYINTSRIATSDYYMTWPQIQDLASDGNEIGGHTAMHVNLPQTDPVEAQRQICEDRVNLVNQGLPAPTDFAYPYGAHNASVEQMVADCGYNSARTVAPAVAETIPPADPYALHQSPGIDLTSLKNEVQTAEQQAPGGWTPLVIHQICNACDSDWISQSDFSGFLDWLQTQVESGAVVVKTVQQVIGGPTQPVIAGPAQPGAPNGWNAIRNSSLENDADSDTFPDCWQTDSYGTNTPTWSRTTDAHTGAFAERVDITGYQSGDAKIVVGNDLGFCTPTVTPGHQYVVTEWYKSSAPVSFQSFSRDAIGAFDFWTSSNTFPASSTWAKATWTTPAIPSGTNGLSFGLAIAANGFVTVDDAGLDDAAASGGGDTTVPNVSVTSPTGGAISGTATISVTASDNIAVDHVDFLIDGSKVGIATIGPYTYQWNSRTVRNGTHTIQARAVDTSGNTTTTSPTTVTVANSVTNLAPNPSLESATGSTPTCWQLGGFGTNSFTWTRTTDAHTGGFAENLNVSSLTDGDRKLITAQDTGTCSVAVTPGHSYAVSNWYKTGFSGLPSMFAYYRNSAGVWTFWATSPRFPAASDWTQANWSTAAVPAGATAISVGMGLNMVGSVTMDDFAIQDNAPPPDTTPPTSTINCDTSQSDGGGCVSGYYNGPVPVSLHATDDLYGVASIRYTTDGSDPSTTNGSVYSGPFTVNSTTTVKYRAYDNAGNAEATNSQLIRIDTTPPTSSVTCDAGACASAFSPNPVSVALAATDAGGSGVDQIVYTTDGTDPTQTNGTTYSGAFTVSSTTTVAYRSYDNAGNAEATNSQVIRIDTTPPTSAISCNGGSCSGTFNSAVSVALSASDEASGSGVDKIVYTTDGSDPTQANGTTYSGAFTVSSTSTVKYRAFDNAGNAEATNSQLISVDTTPPTSAITCNGGACSGTFTSAVSVALSATDDAGGSGLDKIRYTTDGSDPTATNGITYTSAFTVGSTTTVKYRAYDNAGNAEATNTQAITVNIPDTAAPTSAIACNGGSCSGTFGAAVSVTLSATDTGGSGVDKIVYTTDGTDPTATNGTTYTGAFTVPSTTTVKYRAYDNAGNAEATNTQAITIQIVLPSSSVRCNAAACATAYYTSAVSVTLSATDVGGPGVAAIRYTTDGTDPTQTNGKTYTTAFSLTGNTTVKYRAYDTAGNAEATNSATIHVDTTAPVSTIKCNDGSCAPYLKSPASVTFSATDADSGVASIKYTTDGTDPTTTHGTTYTTPVAVTTTKTFRYRAFDNTGHAEAIHSQQVRVDGTAPTASLTAPNAGTFVVGTVNLTASASDTGGSGLDHVDFLVDGQTVGSDATSPYSFAWNSTTVADGTHTLAAKAVDGAGNTTTSSSVSVVVTNHNLLSNPSLETATGTTPTCWIAAGSGTNTFTLSRASGAHDGSFAETLDVNSFTSGDRELVSAQDAGACAPAATAGHTYTVIAWYKTLRQPSIFAYYRTAAGTWTRWTQSTPFPAVLLGYAKALWKSPPLPSGATAISVGLGLTSAGSVTMDDFSLFDTH